MGGQDKSREIDQNLVRFMEILPTLVQDHAGKWALMRHGSVIDFYESAIYAQIAGNTTFDDKIFSIQPVKEEAEELGYYTYAVGTRLS